MASNAFEYAHIAANGNFLLASGSGHVLHTVVVNAPGTTWGPITIYDGTSTSGDVVAVITPTTTTPYIFDVELGNGLFVTTAGTTAGDITVTFL